MDTEERGKNNPPKPAINADKARAYGLAALPSGKKPSVDTAINLGALKDVIVSIRANFEKIQRALGAL